MLDRSSVRRLMPAHDMTTASITCAGCKHAYTESALFCPNCGRAKLRESASDPLVGKLLGERFQVQELIGQGGSGTIYRAEHVTLRRKVAIKVLHNELSRDDLAVERFRREATTVAEIDNEHIVEIHDFGRTFDGRLYLAMELLEGDTLDHVLAVEKTLSVERTADILIQVGEALMEAHAIGYVHRDLRPRNVYLAVRRGKANFVKLLDFGLAKLVETDASAASTSLGMTFGDPRYMSPEAARGDRIDRRADIYQLGCLAYEMLTGAPPFSGARVFDILTKQVTESPTPLPTRRPGTPLWMEAAVAKMLAKDPANRFATTTRMVEALRRGLETGEIMDDEIARRRESIPPPSVSRVMQRMGLTAEGVDAAAAALPAPVAAAPVPVPQPDPKPAAEPRQRTGTPRVLPKVSVEEPTQPPVSGLIDPPSDVIVVAPMAPVVAAPPKDDPGISQVWYDDGENLGNTERARGLISPSTTDLYEDEPVRKKRWPLIAAALGVCGVLGLTIALAMGGGGDKPAPVATPAPTAPTPTPVAEIAPSQIIAPDPAPAAAPTPVAVDPAKPAITHTAPAIAPTPTTPTKPVVDGHYGDLFNTSKPAPTPTVTPPTPVVTPPTPVVTPPTPPTPVVTPPNPTKPVTNNPQDPYGDSTDVPADASPTQKAEALATIGQQQLGNNDTAGAAASFKKALELDPKNANAVIGMGEIALRQGLFGDAIAHLTKASHLAPKSSKVFTLLGEAYLNSGNSKEAANNFKKALQLDPDNARARDGYNEASSRVPPPTDDGSN